MTVRFCNCAANVGRYSTHSETCPAFGAYASPTDLLLDGRLMVGPNNHLHPERYDCERDGMCEPATMGPDLPTYDEMRAAVFAFTDEHPLTHPIRRLGDRTGSTLVCLVCPDAVLFAPSIPRPAPTGIAASASRFD